MEPAFANIFVARRFMFALFLRIGENYLKQDLKHQKISLNNWQIFVPSYKKDTRIAFNSGVVLLLLTLNRYFSIE